MFVIILSHKIALILSCSTLLIVGSVVILDSMTIDYQTVYNAGKFGFLGAVAAGFFGYFIGKIFETSGNN